MYRWKLRKSKKLDMEYATFFMDVTEYFKVRFSKITRERELDEYN